jgi:superfamily II DNA or RNA helicase
MCKNRKRTATERFNAITLKATPEKRAVKTKPVHKLGATISMSDLRQHAGGWQAEGFKILLGKIFRSINAPMGCGKSMMACYLAAHELSVGKYERVIFAVPQDVIAAGFTQGMRFKVGNRTVTWDLNHNLCSNGNGQTTVKIIEFLKNKRSCSVFSDRVLVCTHAALVRAYVELEKRKQLHLFKKAHLFIDEAHHVQNAEANGAGLEIRNQLGTLVSYVFKAQSGVTLMTATPFRGDGTGLLTSEQVAALNTFTVPWDEYFATLGLELVYDFVLYDGLHNKAIASLRKQGVITRDNRVIAYIPKTGQAFSIGDKTADFDGVIDAFWKSWEVLDFVHLEGRDARKERLFKDSELDVNCIVAMNMMREGANWKPADTSLVIGPRHSLTDMVQTLGRLLRKYPGKKTVRVLHLLPFTFDRTREDQYRTDLNNYLKAVFCSAMVIEDVFCPVKLRFAQKIKGGGTRTITRTLTRLQQVFPDSAEQESFRVAVKDAIVESQIETMGKEELRQLLLDVVTEELKERGRPTKDAKAVTEQLWYQFARKTARTRGLSVTAIDAELLDRVKNPFKCLLQYTSGKVGGRTFKELRKAAVRGITMDDCHALAAERGGECLGVVN